MNWFKYFDIEIAPGRKARFKRDFFGAVWVFQANCAPTGNVWNEPGPDTMLSVLRPVIDIFVLGCSPIVLACVYVLAIRSHSPE